MYKYCVVLGIDGMGNFNKFANTPVMDKLFENGAKTYMGLSMDPTISAENWGAMLLGAIPTVHGLTNGICGSREYTNKNLPSIFTKIRKAFPDAYLASVCNWNPINYGIIEHDINADLMTADNDEGVTEKILETVKKHPMFLFVQFDDCDGAGHHYGYGTDEHIKQIEVTDNYIQKVIDAYKQEEMFEDTLFVVVADHGGFNHGHGGYTDGEKYIFMGLSGKTVNNCDIKYAKTIDIASIVLHAFDIEIPEYNIKSFSSQVPEGVFNDYEERYFVPENKTVVKVSKPTPVIDSDKGLYSYVDKKKIKMALFFDDSVRDITGQYQLKEYNVIKYYSDGVLGSRGEFGITGYAMAEDLKFGKDDFSVAVWIKIDKHDNDECVICATRDMRDDLEKTSGFDIVRNSHNIYVEFESGKNRRGITTAFPEGFSDGWIHLIVSVNKSLGKVNIYYNFDLAHSVELGSEFFIEPDILPLVIGNDGSLTNNNVMHPNLFNIDDLIVFNEALSFNSVKDFEKYYND